MAQERRPGDWQHRTHKQANTILRNPNAKRWYEDTFWIIFFLVVFWPVGLFLMWRSDWPLVAKVGVTVILGLIIAYMWYGYMLTAQSQ